jgi:hypothetical protein
MPRTPEAEGTVYRSSGGNAIKRHPTSADTVPCYISIPSELEDAARIDGASAWAIFQRIMRPLGANGVVVVRGLTEGAIEW